MKKYLNMVRQLVKKFKEANFVQLPREENMEAGALAKAALAREMLPAPRGMPARPGACQRAHASTPRPWLLHARPGLGCCVLAQALDAACSCLGC